ncbi:transposase domain-containing protein, partial [bacterium]|nr:transposase domain-containing protein [bacterium]
QFMMYPFLPPLSGFPVAHWMFAGSHEGAKMTAVMMTIIQTCKLRGINPHAYPTDVLPRLASQKTTSLDGLTPLDWEKA